MDISEDLPSRLVAADSEMYNPPVDGDNDETHEMYNIAGDEDAVNEMEEFIAGLEKDDITEVIRRGLKQKLETATAKLTGLFKRQQELNAEEEEEVRAQLERELQLITQQQAASSPDNDKQARKQDQMKLLMLQKKVTVLNNQVELSEQKARSVTMQWALDKDKYRKEIRQKQIEVDELQTRLTVMERKARLREQMSRDSNMVRAADGGPDPDGSDTERLKEQLAEAHKELAEKRRLLSEANRGLGQAKTELFEAESRADVLTKRVEELVRNADTMHEQIETREKEESSLAKQQRAALKEIEDLVKELHREQANGKDLELQLAAVKMEHEQQLTVLDVPGLQARIASLEGELGGHAGKAAERERELKRQLDHARIEKEQIVRENKHLALAINKVAYMCKAITADFDTHKSAADSKIDTETKKASQLYAEVKALSKSIDSVAGDAVKRATDMQARMEQLKRKSDAAEAEHEKDRQELEQRVADLQRELAGKEKTLRARIAQATQAENEAKESAVKELTRANTLIDRLSMQMETMKRASPGTITPTAISAAVQSSVEISVGAAAGGADGDSHSHDTAVAEPETKPQKTNKQQEAELKQMNAKLAEKDNAIAKLKEDLAKSTKKRKELEEDIEAERDRYDELRADHNLAKDEIDHLEAQLAINAAAGVGAGAAGAGARSVSLPQNADTLQQREMTKLRNELQAAKKELAANAKELKALQRDKRGGGGENKSMKSPQVTKGKRMRTLSKVVSNDSDNEEGIETSATAAGAGAARERAESDALDGLEEESSQYEAFKRRYEADRGRCTAAAAQTDTVLPATAIDRKRVEAILRQVIHTDNYYYNKHTGTFTNVYPIEEHLMEDLVGAFHALGSDVLDVMRAVTGYGATPNESSRRTGLSPQSVVETIEGMILKGSKELVINLDKSKERGFKRLMDEQRGRSEHLAGALEGDIAYAKEEAMQEAAEKFQAQLQAIMAEKKRLEQDLEETQDLLAVERAKVVEMQYGGTGTGTAKARSQRLRSKSGSHSDGGFDDSGDDADGFGFSDEDHGPKGIDVGSQKSGGVSFKGAGSPKDTLAALRKKKSTRRSVKGSAAGTGALTSATGVDGTSPSQEDGAALSEGEEHSRKLRRMVTNPAVFDDLDTAELILRKLTREQSDDMKTLVLLELKEEVKQNVAEKEKERQEQAAADAAKNHHVARDLQALRDDLVAGKLQHIGEVRVSDFDRLKNKAFGPDDLISLTTVEHHVRYGAASDANDAEDDEATLKTMSKEEAKRHALKRRQYRMLIRSMVLQRELLQKNVVTHIPILELMRYKHATETALAQLAALSAWRALNYYRNGGVFRDVLMVHLEVIDNCIAAAGGWRAALTEIEDAPDDALQMDTAQWPEFFRVRVLETLRSRYAVELERTKIRLQASSTFAQPPQGPTLEMAQRTEVLPFEQTMTTEGNKRRVDKQVRNAASRAVELLEDDQFSALNRSVKKLKATATASYLAYQTSRSNLATEDDDDDQVGWGADSPGQLRRMRSDAPIETLDLSPTRAGSAKGGLVNAETASSRAVLTGALDGIPEGEGREISTCDSQERPRTSEGPVLEGSSPSLVANPTSTTTASAAVAATGTLHAAPPVQRGLANHPLLSPANTKPSAVTTTTAIAGALQEGAGVQQAAKAHEPSGNAWLQDEGDQTPVPSTTSAATGGEAGKTTSSVAAARASRTGAAVGRPESPDDSTVVSNLTNNTGAGPTAAHHHKLAPPAMTKAQRMREKAQKASIKFNAYDAMKQEEKKRKAVKAAEAAAAGKLATNDGMAQLAGRLGDVFGLSEDDGGSETDLAGGSLLSDSGGSQAGSVPARPMVRHPLPTEGLHWLHAAADKVVESALYGEHAAVQLLQCVVDAIGQWEAGQGAMAAAVFKSTMHLNLAQELLSELVQGAERRNIRIPREVLEIRDKFRSILGVISKLAQDHEHLEHQMLDAHAAAGRHSQHPRQVVLHQPLLMPGSQLPVAHVQQAGLAPHVPSLHSHAHAHHHSHATSQTQSQAQGHTLVHGGGYHAVRPTPADSHVIHAVMPGELTAHALDAGLAHNPLLSAENATGSVQYGSAQTGTEISASTTHAGQGRVAIERAYEQPLPPTHAGLVHSTTLPSEAFAQAALGADGVAAGASETTAEGPQSPQIHKRRSSVAVIGYTNPAQPFATANVPGTLTSQRQRAAALGLVPLPHNLAVRRKAPMFDNSTQTAHGSIQLHELTSVADEAENISGLVSSLMLDGWEDKIKQKVKRKKETHTIITSAMAVPTAFLQAPVDPFAKHETSQTVFRGFEHAYFDEAEFEVMPGVRLASAHRVAAALRAHIRADRDKTTRRKDAPDTSAVLTQEDDIHIGVWTMQTNIRYCIRSDGVEYGKRLRRVPYYMKVPVVPGCDAVIFPNVFPVQQGVNLITGERSSVGKNLALPEDVLLLQVAEDTKLPPGLTHVVLSPQIKLSSSLEQFMKRAQPLPPGHHLVQLTEQSFVALPEGVEVRSGVTIAANPADLELPANVLVVNNPLNEELPEYMHKLTAVMNEEDDLLAEMKLNEFCCIVKRPTGIDFGLGVEILQRPPGHPLPPGMTLLSKDAYPDGLVLPEELELVQLTPRYDLPLGCRLSAEWKVWPRPDAMRLPPGVQLVYPESTAAVPKLPSGVCLTAMPDIPYGVTLPPNTQAVEIFGSAAGKYPLPEGAILAPGITVLGCDGLIPPAGANGQMGTGTVRALNVLLVHRMPGAELPPLVERGSKSDLPVGTLLAENMDIVRVAVRFELPPGVRIQAGAKLGPYTQIAPGTDLVTLSGGRPDEDYACTIRVLEWPHGVHLTPGTEFVRRPPPGYYLPVGYKEVVPPRVDPASLHGAYAMPPLPDYGMLVQLPRAIHYATAQNLAEQVTVGLENMLADQIVTMPLGMVLAARRSRQNQWPGEMCPAPKAALNVSLIKAIDRMNSENNQVRVAVGSTVHTFAHAPHESVKKSAVNRSGDGPSMPMALHIEVVKLRPHYSLPPGCEIVPGLVVQRKPFWLHVPSGVELVTKYADASGRLLPFPCAGVTRVQLRPDYILTGDEVDQVATEATDPAAAQARAAAPATPATESGPSRPGTQQSDASRDWELVDLEHTVKLSPTSLPDHYELVHVSELLEGVHSWGPYLKGIEAVNRAVSEDGHTTVLPPFHFLIQRPLIHNGTPLPRGFQLSVSHEYATWEVPALPPNIELVHLVPAYQLPMGINILNTSVLSKNDLNTLRSRGGQPPECNIPQLQSGERISAGFSVIAKPFGSVAMAKILDSDPYYEEEAHAFVRVHDPRHFKLPRSMALAKGSNDIVESVFGAELPSAWRKGYLSRHDQVHGGPVTTLSAAERKPSPSAALQGDLLITDIIKFVRLPHGFPAPRERQKRAQARFALLQPAARKISTILRLRGNRADGSQPEAAGGTITSAVAPPQHTHSHHKKQDDPSGSGGLVVYPRLLCIHRREDLNPDEKREKFLMNAMLSRLTATQQAEAKKGHILVANPHRKEGRATEGGAKGDGSVPKEDTVALLEEALHRAQDLLESEHAQSLTSLAAVAKLTEEKSAIEGQLDEAKEKNKQYERQLSYDEDLKVVIQRLNAKLASKNRELDDIICRNTVVTERLQSQLDLLHSQVAQYQDQAERTEATQAPSAAPDDGTLVTGATAGAGSDTQSPTKRSPTKGPPEPRLTVEHFERFADALHQRYREQVLCGLERMSDLYAVSINSIMAEFETVLVNWPHWSPKELLTTAVAWSRGHTVAAVEPTVTTRTAATVPGSAESVVSQAPRALELRIPSTDDSELAHIKAGSVKGIAPGTGGDEGSATQGTGSRGGPRTRLAQMTFEDETEEMSVLSDSESQILGVAASVASITGSEAISVSGYQPRDLTKDEYGRPIPVSSAFALNVKDLYKQPDPTASIDLVPFTSPIHDKASYAIKRARRLSKIPTSNEIASMYKTISEAFTTATPAPTSHLELSHSLNDLFARQRRASPRKGQAKHIGKLPILVHPGSAEGDRAPHNVRYFDPAVLGAGTGVVPIGSGGSLAGSAAASVVGGMSLVGCSEDGMTVTADLTAREVQEFLRGDEHRQEIRLKLQRSTQEVVHSVRRDFSALLTAVHSSVVASIPKVLDQYASAPGRDTSRRATLESVAVDDYSLFSDSALTALQEALSTTAADASHLMKYALGAVLLHCNLSLQQQDIEGDALRHQLSVAAKKIELLDYLLHDARKKGTADHEHSANDALKERILNLEAKMERLLAVQVDPALSVLGVMVKGVEELREMEKRLKFTALLFKQKAAAVEAKLQANRDFEFNHSHKDSLYQSHSDAEEEEEDTFGIDAHKDGTVQLSKSKNKRIPVVQPLSKQEIKAMKHFAHNARMKARHCHARANYLKGEYTEVMACMMEHMEAYQRGAQQLLPSHMLEQVLRVSVRNFQNISAGARLDRAKAARAPDPPRSPTSLSEVKAPNRRWNNDSADNVSLSGESAVSFNSAGGSLSLSQVTGMTNSYAGSSNTSITSATVGGTKTLKPLRGAELSLQRSMVDAARNLGMPGVKYGAAGSMPMAPAQSHLLLRGHRQHQGARAPHK